MNIRDWPLDRIMQLPDYCFGRRWPIFVVGDTVSAGDCWAISKFGLPERCVVWEFGLRYWHQEKITEHLRLSLGDQLPTTKAEMSALEPLYRDIEHLPAFPNSIRILTAYAQITISQRMYLESGGRRLVIEYSGASLQVTNIIAWVVVSSLPTEVPDWLSSGHLRSP